MRFALLLIAARLLSAQASDSLAYRYLLELCDTIGPRLTGSPQERQARQWAVAKMKEIGLENVREERFDFPRAWTRGHARAELRAPMRMNLRIDALGWSGSTRRGGQQAEIVRVNRNRLAAESARPAAWRGKILLLVGEGEAANPIRVFAEMGGFLDAAAESGAIAVITGDDPSPGTPANLTRIDSAHMSRAFTPLAVVSMVPEHRAILNRLLARGEKPHVWIDVANRMSKGPVETANVIGEIRGREHPEQIVVLGAHLDSWDLGQGATDDGFGVAAVLGAAAEIRRSGTAPARTIRFVLFSGEEQGVKGSKAYVAAHAGEMKNHVAALMSDMGDGPPVGVLLNGRADVSAALAEAAKDLSLGERFRVSTDPYLAGDSLPFTWNGIPAIDMMQESRDFSTTHHTAADTADKVKPENLARQATVLAKLTGWIAGRKERIGPVLDEAAARDLVSKLGIADLLSLLGFTPTR